MEKLPVAELDFSKLDGLISVVTQASETGEILMQAYANRKALELTLSSGYAHYWSRSRSCLLYTSPSPRDKRQSRMPSSA